MVLGTVAYCWQRGRSLVLELEVIVVSSPVKVLEPGYGCDGDWEQMGKIDFRGKLTAAPSSIGRSNLTALDVPQNSRCFSTCKVRSPSTAFTLLPYILSLRLRVSASQCYSPAQSEHAAAAVAALVT